jgi:hypothetical protein
MPRALTDCLNPEGILVGDADTELGQGMHKCQKRPRNRHTWESKRPTNTGIYVAVRFYPRVKRDLEIK